MTADEIGLDTAPSGVLPWFRGLIFAAVCAGLLAGASLTLLHHFLTSPLIAQAELFEAAAPTNGQDHAHGTPGPEAEGWRRTALTALADISAGIGFALLLCAGLALGGGTLSLRAGLLWGLAGFVSFSLAPAFGLPPELPGTEVPPVLPRQIWWLATTMATAGGLALLAFTRRVGWVLCAVLLLAAPHIIGAPRLAAPVSLAPEALTHLFVAITMASNLLFWLVLGFGCVLALRRSVPLLSPPVRHHAQR